LTLANVPDDQLGNAYEYLIKEFADDSGHTAAEFYTNRTVVKLMTMMVDPQPGETVYDPTCGSGGLLLNCALHLKEQGKEYRTLKLYGQEINLITSAIARMNMFLHGIEKISETVDPGETDLDIYIGLEHLDSESIHIKRRGTPSDVSGGKLKCYPGDTIFGKRRAYQRKAAIVDFEGICSAHAFVLRAIPEVIDPLFFPFFLHSDLFMHRAVDISVGGLSPTINWKHLRVQEFLLPPKDQQAKIAKLLWAMDEVIEKMNHQIFKLNQCKKSSMREWLIQGIGNSEIIESPAKLIPKNWITTNFDSILLEMKSGLSRRIVSQDIGIPVMISGNIQEGKLDISELKYWYINDPQGANVSNYILNNGDILLCFINSLAQIGKCCLFEDIGRNVIYTTNLFRIVPVKNVNNVFLCYLLFSDLIQRKIRQITMPAVNQASFTKRDFLRIKLQLPPMDEQIEIANRLSQIDTTIDIARQKFNVSKALQKSLINQVFSTSNQDATHK